MLDSIQRTKISAQLLSTPAILEGADLKIATANAENAKSIATDTNVNKPIFDKKNDLCNFYTRELKYLDGIVRQEITETDLSNSASFKVGNFFFPNQPTVVVPSIPGNVWTNATPFALNAAIGKNYVEQYPLTGQRTEINILSDLEAQFTIIETCTELQRITGEICASDPGDPLALPLPIPPSAGAGPFPTMQNASTAILALVAEWKTMLNEEKAILVSNDDTDTVREPKNSVAENDIDFTLSELSIWEALVNFIPLNPGVITDCILYDSTDPNTLGDTKYRSSKLPSIKVIVSDRKNYLQSTRIVDLISFLGNIVQSADGTVTSKTGLYGERYNTINVRLNMVLGDNLVSIANNNKLKGTVESGKGGTEDKFDAWSNLLKATTLEAPTSNTKYVQVKDSVGFTAGNTIFIVSDTQPEASFIIELVESNRIKMTTKVNEKYRPDEGARLYKEL